MPHQDALNPPSANVLQHPVVRGTKTTLVGADVIVDVGLGNLPALGLGMPLTIRDLPVDTEHVAVPVLGAAGVDTDPDRHGPTLATCRTRRRAVRPVRHRRPAPG